MIYSKWGGIYLIWFKYKDFLGIKMKFKNYIQIHEKLASTKILSGIPHFKNLIQQGDDIVEKILTQPLIIIEKQDGQKFSLKKTDQGIIEYWSKNKKLDRAFLLVNKNWRILINRLEDLRKETGNFSKLPNNSEISGEFIKGPIGNTIEYTKIPRGNWVVFYAEVAGKKYTSIDYQILHQWADYFQSERQPVLFDGILSEKQKEEIIGFLVLSDEERISKYKTKDFTTFIIEVIKPGYIPISGEKIEGIVIYSRNKLLPISIVKLVDPSFMEKNKAKWNLFGEEIEEFKMKLISFIVKNTTTDLINSIWKENKDELEKMSGEEKYVFLLDKVFLQLINRNDLKVIFEEFRILDGLEPNPNVDLDHIDRKVKIYLKNWFNIEFYILMLLIFNKERTRRSGKLYKSLDLEKFNSIVKLLRKEY